MRTFWMAIAAVAAGGVVGPAFAQSCEERVDDLAAEHRLSAAPPAQPGTTAPTENGMSRDLARSGGVIAPPPTGDVATIEPPALPRNGMPTAPPVDGAPSAGGDAPARQPGSDAAIDLQAETLLQGALSAAREGDEAGCMERLSEAEQILATR